MRLAVSLGFALLASGCASENSSVADHAGGVDLDRFASWISGEWDNVAQVEAESAADIPDEDIRARYALRYIEVDAEALGGRVFAIQNYNSGDGFDGPIERISLHRFSLPDGSDEIVHEIYLFEDRDFRAGLVDDLSPLENIQPDALSANDGCRMFWRWTGERFEGATRPGACVTSSYTPEPITVEASGVLEAGRLARHDRNFSSSGEEVPRPGYKSAEVFLRPSD